MRLVVDPEVGAFLPTVDWHMALGPINLPRFHSLLDRRLFVSSSANANANVPSSSTSQTHAPTVLVHVYTPGRVFPYPHTSHLTLRLYAHARVRDLFYEIADCLAGRVVEERGIASLSPSADERRRANVREAQRWRIGKGFAEIGTTSVLPRLGFVNSGGHGLDAILFADYLGGDWVISDLIPVNALDGVVSFRVIFKRA